MPVSELLFVFLFDLLLIFLHVCHIVLVNVNRLVLGPLLLNVVLYLNISLSEVN